MSFPYSKSNLNQTKYLYTDSNDDSTTTLSVVTLDAIERMKCFNISFVEDLILEDDEVFVGSITVPGGVGQGAIRESTVIIKDNDGEIQHTKQHVKAFMCLGCYKAVLCAL